MAEDMFKEIKGKTRGRHGFAMIATKEIKKGTTILQENPQLVWKNPTGVPEKSDIGLGIAEVRGIHAAFHEMKKSDQDEYLQLWNLCEHLDLTNPEDKMKLQILKNNICLSFPDYNRNEIILAMKIHGIYKSNSNHEETFVYIKTSKFNHSCNANAILRDVGTTESPQIEIIAISKILYDEEIGINLAVEELTMQNLQTRRNFLLKQFGFICKCDLCYEEEMDGDNFRYELFKNMDIQAARLVGIIEEGFLMKGKNHGVQMFRQLIQCHKEKYKYAKECNAQRRFIVYEIVSPGFDDAVGAYLYAKQCSDPKLMEEFKMNGINFARVAVQMAKIVIGERNPAYETWKYKRDHFEKFVEENQPSIHVKKKSQGASRQNMKSKRKK